MTTDETQPEAADTVIEELTAYLDGELDEATQLSVETRLGEDPKYLNELHSLQRTWDTLDHLPMFDAGKDFTQTTMEMIVDQVKGEKRSQKISWSFVLVPLLLLTFAGGLFAAGYAYQISNLRKPDEALLEHLPVIERHEVYASIDNDLAFLKQLSDRNLFPQLSYDPIKSFEQAAAPPEEEVKKDSRADRLAYIESLDVEQKADLKDKLEDFLKMDVEKQKASIEFHQLLFAQPEYDRLVFVLNEYYHWLKSLDAGVRARLQGKPADERLAEVDTLRDEARAQDARKDFEKIASLRPSREDSDTIFNWYLQLISSKEALIREHFPKSLNAYREKRGKGPLPEKVVSEFDRREVSLLASFLMHYDREFVDQSLVTKDESDMLVAILSPESRDLLFTMPEQYQRDVVLSWIETVNEIYRKTFRVSREPSCESSTMV